MAPVFEPWDETRGAEIIAKHTALEGATLVILHALPLGAIAQAVTWLQSCR